MLGISIGEIPIQTQENEKDIAISMIDSLLANPGKSVSVSTDNRRRLMIEARKEAASRGYRIDRKLVGSAVTIWVIGRLGNDTLVTDCDVTSRKEQSPQDAARNAAREEGHRKAMANPFSRYNIVINVMKVVVPGEWVELREVIERLELPEQKRTHATRLLVGTTLIKAGWVRSQRRPERGGNPKWGYSFEGQILAGPLATDSIMAAARGLIDSGRYWFHVDDILRAMGLTGSLAERTQIARTLESKGTYRRRKGRKDDSPGIKLWGYRVAPMMSDRVAYDGVA